MSVDVVSTQVTLSQTILGWLYQPRRKSPVSWNDQGWVQLDRVVQALEKRSQIDLTIDQLYDVLRAESALGLELQHRRVRANPPPPRSVLPPVILYYACSAQQAAELAHASRLSDADNHLVYFSSTESHAWKIGHRCWPDPRVLYLDAHRAGRYGVYFHRKRHSGMYCAPWVPTHALLNVHPAFGHQFAAGGFLIRRDGDGRCQVALVRVNRGRHVNWEVAKGKMEPGETPEACAIREVREELGIANTLRVVCNLAPANYPFFAPGRKPRLKHVYLYLLRSETPVNEVSPALNEGIDQVAWFTLSEARRVIRHPSLFPALRRLNDVLPTLSSHAF